MQTKIYAFVFIISLFAASCSIQKRHYRPGFFVQFSAHEKAVTRAFAGEENQADTTNRKQRVVYPETNALPPAAAAAAHSAGGKAKPVEPDTLLPEKKPKKQLAPLPGETPEETKSRGQYIRQAWIGLFMVIAGVLLIVFFDFELGAVTVMSGFIIGIIGLAVLLLALVLIAWAKARLRRREKGLPERKKKQKDLTIRKTLWVLGISAVVGTVTTFIFLNTGIVILSLLILPAGVVFLLFLLILIGLLIARFNEKRIRKKGIQEQIATEKSRQKAIVWAIVGIGLTIAGVLLLVLSGMPFGKLLIVIGLITGVISFANMLLYRNPKPAAGSGS